MHVKASSNIAQCPVLRTVQSALHFTSLTDLFTQTPYRLLWEASSHMLQLMREGWLYTYAPLSIARYSFIQLSELEQCKVKKLAQDLNTAAQDSNPGSRSRESEALPLSHCTLCVCTYISVWLCAVCACYGAQWLSRWNVGLNREKLHSNPVLLCQTLGKDCSLYIAPVHSAVRITIWL